MTLDQKLQALGERSHKLLGREDIGISPATILTLIRVARWAIEVNAGTVEGCGTELGDSLRVLDQVLP
jgi:hypothetical protein